MLPALERCALILSRLNGIVRYQGSDDTMGFSSHQIDLVMDTLACLNLVSARILTYVVDELDMFAAFSEWLRYEIDRLASHSSSSPSEDIPEKEATIDHSKVLLYIQTAMTTSRLSIFFNEEAPAGYGKEWEGAERGQAIFELLNKQLQEHDENLPCKTALPRIELLCKHLVRQATAVFQRIAEAEKRNVLFGQPTALGVASKDSPVVIRLCPQVQASAVQSRNSTILTFI
jgi:anaphase-promoting complex subunit 4